MKKFLSMITAAAAAFMMFSCASVSVNNTVYVEGTENFEAADLTVTKLGTVYNYGDFNASFTSPKTEKDGFSVFGVGKTTEKTTMKGEFKKGEEKLFNMDVSCVAEMWGNQSGKSKDVWGSATVTVTTGKNGTPVPMQKDDEGYIIRDGSYEVSVVQQYKTEQGKLYKLPFVQFAGACLFIDGELYGVVDLIANSPKIYTNPSFSRALSEDEKAKAYSYMILTHKVYKNFQ